MIEIEANGNSLEGQRDHLRALLVQLPKAFEEEPQTWFRTIARGTLRLERNLDLLPPEVRIHLEPILTHAYEILKEEAHAYRGIDKSTINDEHIAQRAEVNIMKVSRTMAERFAPSLEHVTEQRVPIEQLIHERPDRFRTYKVLKGSNLVTMFGIRHPETGEWHDAVLPLDNNMWYKGGLARAVLKAYADVSYSEELPWNDLDVIFVGDETKAREQARIMEVDPDGVECLGVEGETVDFTEYVNGRDVTNNQVSFGNDGLHFIEEAMDSVKTGHIELTAEYMPNRAIFGVDKFKMKDANLVKPRGAMRYVKSVTEGKATSFDYPEVNTNLGLGVYMLVLAKRWSAKPNFGEQMQKMFFLAQKMGLVAEGETDIYSLLRQAHARLPFFDMDKKITTMPDVARWKVGKLIKQIDREFAWRYGIPNKVKINRTLNDSESRIITMDGFELSQDDADRITQYWPDFVVECRERKQRYDELGFDMLYRFFYELENQTPPENIDE